MAPPFTISDLRQRPEFFDSVADRIWRTWWQPQGTPFEYIRGRLQQNMTAAPIPLALVAHDREIFLGTASVIASDLPERPQLTPWLAAVWVEQSARRCGVGGALVSRALRACRALGFERTYLCARPDMTGFYEKLGWKIIERGIGEHRLNIFVQSVIRDAATISRSPP
jgi:GNAT superfamily N-acetyltransferase